MSNSPVKIEMIESETPAESVPAETPVPNSTPPVETPIVPPSSDNSANVDKMLQVFQQLASQQGTQSKFHSEVLCFYEEHH